MRFSQFFTSVSLSCLLLAGCEKAADQLTEKSTEAQLTQDAAQIYKLIPHAELPDTVSPKSYRVDMTIDPQQDGMSGTVAIDVTINESEDRIWIHAKEMTVKSAKIDYANGSSKH